MTFPASRVLGYRPILKGHNMTRKRRKEFRLATFAIVASITLAFVVAVVLGYYFDPYPLAKIAGWFHG